MANLLKGLLAYAVLFVITTAFVWWVGNDVTAFDLSLEQSGDIVLIGWAVLWFKENTTTIIAYYYEKEKFDKRR